MPAQERRSRVQKGLGNRSAREYRSRDAATGFARAARATAKPRAVREPSRLFRLVLCLVEIVGKTFYFFGGKKAQLAPLHGIEGARGQNLWFIFNLNRRGHRFGSGRRFAQSRAIGDVATRRRFIQDGICGRRGRTRRRKLVGDRITQLIRGRRGPVVPQFNLQLADKIIHAGKIRFEVLELIVIGAVFQAACPVEPLLCRRTGKIRRGCQRGKSPSIP